MMISPKANRSGHFSHLHPFWDMAFFALPFLSRFVVIKNRFIRLTALYLPIFLVITNFFNVFYRQDKFYADYTRNLWSPAIVDLKEYLDGQPKIEENLVIMNWGFSEQLYFLSSGKKRVHEYVFPPMLRQNESEMVSDYNEFFKSLSQGTFFVGKKISSAENIYYLMYINPNRMIARVNDVFKEYLSKNGVEVEVEKVFNDSDGMPLFHIIKLKNTARLFGH